MTVIGEPLRSVDLLGRLDDRRGLTGGRGGGGAPPVAFARVENCNGGNGFRGISWRRATRKEDYCIILYTQRVYSFVRTVDYNIWG